LVLGAVGFLFPASHRLAPILSPGAEHLVLYHFVVEGVAKATVVNGTDLDLQSGDIVVFPHGDAHELRGNDPAKPIDAAIVLAKIAKRDLSVCQWGGGSEQTRFVSKRRPLGKAHRVCARATRRKCLW